MRPRGVYGYLKKHLGRPGKGEIVEGRVYPVLLKLAWPMIATSMLQTLYELVDTVWLGRLPAPESTLSVGALAIAWPFVFLLLSIEIGLGISALAMISQHTGAKKYEEAFHDTGQLFFLFIVISIILGGVGYLVAEDFLNLLTNEGDMVPYAVQYLRITFLGFPVLMTFAAFSFSLRAWGDTITPTLVMTVSLVINIILDPILIFGWGPFPMMGIRGAAVATVFARTVGLGIALYLLYTGKVGLKLKLHHLKPDLVKIKKFVIIGIPASLARLEEAASFVLLTGLLAMLPHQDEVLAAYGIGGRLTSITFVVLMGMMMAVSTMVGQALGANKPERAEESTKKAILFMILFMIIISSLMVAYRYPIMRFFTNDPMVVDIGVMYLTILAIGAPFFAVYEGVSGALNGSGHTGQQFVLSASRLWGMRIPMILLFSFGLSMHSNGAWIGIALSNVGAGVVAYLLFMKGKWKKKIIDD